MPVVGGHAGITILPLFSQVLDLFCVHEFVKPSVYIKFDFSLCFYVSMRIGYTTSKQFV